MGAGITCGGGTDAPFGGWNPWAAMAAAVDRRTGAGELLGGAERVSPETALGLFTSRLENPGGASRRVAVGEAAELCVLDEPWCVARRNLAAVRVCATLRSGEVIYHNQQYQGRKVA
jgi:predicted amidohydrolase YtcJ